MVSVLSMTEVVFVVLTFLSPAHATKGTGFYPGHVNLLIVQCNSGHMNLLIVQLGSHEPVSAVQQFNKVAYCIIIYLLSLHIHIRKGFSPGSLVSLPRRIILLKKEEKKKKKIFEIAQL